MVRKVAKSEGRRALPKEQGSAHRSRFLLPHVDPQAIARPSAEVRLIAESHHPLTLLVAPPGFGKTTALAHWLKSDPPGVVYFAAGSRDSDLTRFVTIFVAAVESVSPGTGLVTREYLRHANTPDAYLLAETLADELASMTDDATVVIDDYHCITAPDVHAFLGELLRLAPPGLHLVIASHRDPPFSWARFRFQGRLAEIRARDLRLTQEQTRQLLQQAGALDPPEQLVRLIWEQAEGWPAGLRGLAMTLAHGPIPLYPNLVPDETIFDHVDDFLIQEVFSVQPPEVQQALLRLAVTHRFDRELVAALVTDEDEASGPHLAEVITACPYIESEDQSHWMRFHPLFRRFLVRELGRRSREGERRALSRRAGELLAARGLVEDAMTLLGEANDLDGAAALVEREMNVVLARQDWRTLEHWLEALPPQLIEQRPWLMVGRAWVSHLSGRLAPLGAYTERIERLITPAYPDAAEIRGICSALRVSNTMSIDQDPRAAVSALRQAVAAIPPTNRFAHGLAVCFLSLALQASGETDAALRRAADWTEREVERVDAGFIAGLQANVVVNYWAGRLHACAAAADDVLAFATRHDLPIAAGWARRGLGMVAYMQNRLEDAILHFSAIVGDHERGNMLGVTEGFIGLARSYAAAGRDPEARDVLRKAAALLVERKAIELMPLVHACDAILLLQSGKPDVEKALARTAGATLDAGPLNLQIPPLVARVRCLLVSGRPQDLNEAARHLQALEDRAVRSHNMPVQLQVGTFRAILLDLQGDRTAAAAELGLVIGLGAPERFIRLFLDLEPQLRPLLLSLAKNQDEVVGLPALLTALGPAYGVAQTPAVSPSLELLTMRESEVLDHLAARLTYKEIAYELSISPETVKRHVNSIYSKLGVGTRREALLKAQELGWHSAA